MKLHENIFYTKCDSFYEIENLIADAGSKSATCMIEPHVQLDIMVKKMICAIGSGELENKPNG